MSTLNNTDLFPISRSGTTYKVEFDDIRTKVISDNAMMFPAGVRNVLVNGDFGLSDGTQTGIFSIGPGENRQLRCWIAHMDGSGSTRVLQKVNNTLGQGFHGLEPRNTLRLSVTNPGTGATFNTLSQRIENVRTLAGGQATLSFWAKSTSPLSFFCLASQFFGTGGSPSSIVDAPIATFNTTTSWQFFSASFTIPSLSGKTLGSNGDNYLQLSFYFPTSGSTVDLALVQLEQGPMVSPFERRTIGIERLMTQRYFDDDSNVAMGGYAAAAGGIRLGRVSFKTQMRASPSVSLVTAGGSNYSSLSTSNITADGFTVLAQANGAGQVNANFSYTATCEF